MWPRAVGDNALSAMATVRVGRRAWGGTGLSGIRSRGRGGAWGPDFPHAPALGGRVAVGQMRLACGALDPERVGAASERHGVRRRFVGRCPLLHICGLGRCGGNSTRVYGAAPWRSLSSGSHRRHGRASGHSQASCGTLGFSTGLSGGQQSWSSSSFPRGAARPDRLTRRRCGVSLALRAPSADVVRGLLSDTT